MDKTHHYGITPLEHGAYYADVPLADGSKLREHFGFRKHKEPLNAALAWQLINGVSEWGIIAWRKIVAGRIQEVKGRGVNLSLKSVKNRNGKVTYSLYAVEWTINSCGRESTKKTKYFSKMKYGSLEVAEHEASIFCAMKRAERAGSVIDVQSLRMLFGLVH